MKWNASWKLFLLLSVVSCFTPVAHAEDIIVEGGGASIAGFFIPIKEPFEEETHDKLITNISTPAKGLIAIEKGLADIATAAVSLEDMIAAAKKHGVTVDPSTLVSTTIGFNKVLVFVHRTNMIAKLSAEQLRGIFGGKITNWKEVGGKDLLIEVIWGKDTPGQNALFSREILEGQTITDKAVIVTDYAGIRKTVMGKPGAIGIDPMGFKGAATRNPETPSVKSPVIAVTKGNPSPKAKKVLNFLKEVEKDEL